MTSEDQFTSVQWDRDEGELNSAFSRQETIAEEGSVDDHDNDRGDNVSNMASKSDESEDTALHDDYSSDTGDGRSTNRSEQTRSDSSGSGDRDFEVNQGGMPVAGAIKPAQLTKEEESYNFKNYNVASAVSSPVRDVDASSKPYISYLITTTTNHPSILQLSASKQDDGAAITIKVRRRYGDFRFLHACLVNDYPQLLVPPLPSKSNFKYLTGDTFSTDFVHKRLNSLNRFVKYILQHKNLSQSSVFQMFISDTADWHTFTKNLKIKKLDYNEESSGFVSKVVNEDLITEKVMNFLTPAKHKRETNKDILEINDKLKKLYENLIKLDKIFSKLNKKNSDLGHDYSQFSNQIFKLSSVQQPEASNQLGEEANPDITDNISLSQNFKIFAGSLDYFSKSWSSLHQYINESFLVSLRDCSKYIISLTNLIELQHNKRIDLQVLQEYLEKAKVEYNSSNRSSDSARVPAPVATGHNGGLVNNTTKLIKDTLSTSATPHIGSATTDSKVAKLKSKIDQLENEINIQTDLVNDLTNKIINEEYPYWDNFNKNEIKESMVGLCNEEINFYKGLLDNWSDVETKLAKRLEELS